MVESIQTRELPLHLDYLEVSFRVTGGRPAPDVERVLEVGPWQVVHGYRGLRMVGLDVGGYRKMGGTQLLRLSGVALRLLGPQLSLELLEKAVGYTEGLNLVRVDWALQWLEGEPFYLERFRVFEAGREEPGVATDYEVSRSGETRYIGRGTDVCIRDYRKNGLHRRFEVQLRGKALACGGSLANQVGYSREAAALVVACHAPVLLEKFSGFSEPAVWQVRAVSPSVPEVNCRRGLGLARRYFESVVDEEALCLLGKLSARVPGSVPLRKERGRGGDGSGVGG